MATRFAPDRYPARPLRERVAAGLGSAAILALTGYALLLNPSDQAAPKPEPPATLLTLRPPPPPPRVHPVERPVRRRAAGKPSPPNLRNKATPLEAPPPIVRLAPPPPIVVAPHAGTGMAANTGAADRAGPGEGAGGAGNGTGAGGTGEGEGDTAPRQIRGALRYSDLPDDLRARGLTVHVGVSYRVETNGRVTGCSVNASSGVAQVDQLACALIEQRFRFRPARDADGRPFRATVVETHSWGLDRTGYDPPGEGNR